MNTSVMEEVEDDDYLEIPSCIESLVSSAQQMRQLSGQIVQKYQKLLLIYGYAIETRHHEPDIKASIHTSTKLPTDTGTNDKKLLMSEILNSLHKSSLFNNTQGTSTEDYNQQVDIVNIVNDSQTLRKQDSLIKILPLLSELSLLVERCFATIDITLKRVAYHLNKSTPMTGAISSDFTRSKLPVSGIFYLNSNVKIDCVFLSLMDLICSLISLGQVLKNHTSVSRDLARLVNICSLVIDAKNVPPIGDKRGIDIDIPVDKLHELIEFVETIKLSLALDEALDNCDGNPDNPKPTIFSTLLNHFKHFDLILSQEKNLTGFRSLCHLFEDFLQFFSENNLLSETPNLIEPASSRYSICRNLQPILFMNVSASNKLLGISCLFYFYATVFKKLIDTKKCSKLLDNLLRKHLPRHNVVPFDGSNCFIILSSFLIVHRPCCLIRLDWKYLNNVGRDMKKSFESFTGMNKNLEYFSNETLAWSVQLDSEPSSRLYAGERENLITRGLILADEMRRCVRDSFSLHQYFQTPMTKDFVIMILKQITLLKFVDQALSSSFNLLVRSELEEVSFRNKWRGLFLSCRGNFMQMKYSHRRLTPEVFLTLNSICSKPELFLTSQGRFLMSLSLSMLLPALSPQDQLELNSLLVQSLFTANSCFLLSRIKQLTDCQFLYWNSATFSYYYNQLLEEFQSNFDELLYFHMALKDFERIFQVSKKHMTGPNDLSWLLKEGELFSQRVNDELIYQFRTDFVDKICRELEVELRLQTHKELCSDNFINPFKRQPYNFKNIFTNRPQNATSFRIMNQTINLERYVENYLEKICYNLTSLSPHDWYTYDWMLNLASQKYNLRFTNNQLPAQTVHYGLDILCIVKNLPLFSCRYSYDITNQLFVEKCVQTWSSANMMRSSSSSTVGSVLSSVAPSSSTQSLNVVQVQSVSKSIQVHGFGLIDTAVNLTYQTLKKLINIYSRQLKDDRLNASLQREFVELNLTNADGVSSKDSLTESRIFLYERANRLNKRFKTKGSSADTTMEFSHSQATTNSSQRTVCIDSIRQTITQMGNLLGFIRLLKSSALNCASKTVDFLPEIDNLSSLNLGNSAQLEFNHASRGEGYDEVVSGLLVGCENFDQYLKDLEFNFISKTDYLNIIVELFRNLLDQRNSRTSDQAEQEMASSSSLQNMNDGNSNTQTGVQQHQNGTVTPRLNHQENDHLRFFFLLVPALIINYIEYLMNCKERLSSRSSAARYGSLISDDGFPIGVAFLLTILGQTQDFDKLQWFKGTTSKFEQEVQEIERRLADTGYEESLRQTLSMTLRRMKRLQLEYQALVHTLNCALLLFRSYASKS